MLNKEILNQSKKFEVITNSEAEIFEVLSFYEEKGYGLSYADGAKENATQFWAGNDRFIRVHNDLRIVGGNPRTKQASDCPSLSIFQWRVLVKEGGEYQGFKVGDKVRIKKSANNRYIVRDNPSIEKEIPFMRPLSFTIVSITTNNKENLLTVEDSEGGYNTFRSCFMEKIKEEVKKEDNPPIIKTKVNGIKCGHCGDILFSRSRHDMRWCSCGKSAIDGGRDYIKTCGDLDKMTVLEIIVPHSDIDMWKDYWSKENKIGLYQPNSPELAKLQIKEIKPKFESELKKEEVETPKKDLPYFLHDEKTLGLVRNPDMPSSIQYPSIVSNSEATISQDKTEMQFRGFVKGVISKWPAWAADALMNEMIDGYINASGYLKKDPERLSFKLGKRTVEIFGKR